jgi:hypothetical protein
MRGAFVLFEGLLPTVIDSQVLTHVRLARERLNIDIAVIAVACSPKLLELSNKRLERARQIAGGEVVIVRGVRPALPASMSINRLLLARALDTLGHISFVHARSDYAAAVAGPLARRRGLPMLWDCRGDARAELVDRMSDYSPFFKPIIALRSGLMRRESQIAGGTCVGACFVTRQLRDLMSEFLADQPSWVIPCLAPETEFFFDPALRDRVRNELQIGAHETVYVYSGSLAAYQRFDDTVKTFQDTLATGQKARLIVLTPEIDRARQKCAGLPGGNVICRSVDHAQVNGYLNAADLGMLLRDSSPVNSVAFPTKFAEYALAGLKVVMKDSPPSCVEVARELGNYAQLGTDVAPWSPAERARCATQAAQRLGRLAAMSSFENVYKSLVGSQSKDSAAVMAAAPTKARL